LNKAIVLPPLSFWKYFANAPVFVFGAAVFNYFSGKLTMMHLPPQDQITNPPIVAAVLVLGAVLFDNFPKYSRLQYPIANSPVVDVFF
jgi:hypothetical protein